MSKKVKTIIIPILSAAIIIGSLAAFALPKANASKDKTTTIYQTATVEKGDLKVDVSASAIAIPCNIINPNYNDLEFQMSVDELDVVNLKKDQIVNIDINAFPDKSYKGKIESISDKGNVVNGVTSYLVIVSLDKDIKDLKDGMTATCTITTNHKKDALFIPLEAINFKDDGRKYIINPENSEEIEVSTGIYNDDYIEVTKGLKEGDKVQLPSIQKNSNALTPPFMNN